MADSESEAAISQPNPWTRWALVLLPPVVALAIQWLLWPVIGPFVWFILFYPAVFVSSRIGGLGGGLTAAVLSAGLVWWFFVPPESTLAKDPRYLLPVGVFIGMGAAFGIFHERLRKAQRRAAEALAASQAATEVVSRLVEQAPDGIFIADQEGRYTEVNGAACRMLGYAREELIGKDILYLIAPEDVGRLSQARERMLEGEVHVGQWSLRRRDGSYLPVEISARDLPDARRESIVRDISERKRLKQLLESRNADLNRAQAVARIGSWRLDVQRNELQWSDELYRIFGIPLGTPLTYEAFLACVHPDDRAFVDAQWTAALRGEPYDIEHRIVVGGSVKWVREKADLEVDGLGGLVGGIGIAQDITERRRLEEAARLAEETSSGILSISSDAIVSIDGAQRITMFNDGAERIFGFAREEVLGAPLDLLIPEAFRTVHRQHVARFLADPVVARRMGGRGAQVLGRRKDGELFPADTAISKLEVGSKTILTAALRDVTAEHRHLQEQQFLADVGAAIAGPLDYSTTIERVARLVVGLMGDTCIIDVVEADGSVEQRRVVHADPAKATLADAAERLTLPRDRPHPLWTVLETKRPLFVSVAGDLLVPSAQSEEHVRMMRELGARSGIMVPIIAHDRTLAVLTATWDRTGRRHGAHDLRLAEELARRVALALDNARLHEVAQDALDARDQVLGIVAHDLRNPLWTISMQAALLRTRGGGDSHQPRDPADVIERAAARMNRLIQDLLDVARTEAGPLAIERARVSAEQVVRDSVEAQMDAASSAGLDLRSEVTPGLPEIWADRDRLLQVLENLVGNAVRFTRPGGRITVGARPREGEVLFWVADTGNGISAEDLEHVFDRFWQARSTGRRGAGLGLHIVKGIVEAHSGRVWVESTPQVGSTFSFTIQRVAPAEGCGPAPRAR